MTSALMGNYGRPELEFDHGIGSYLFTPAGDRYLDFAMGIAVNCLGHCHPELVQALGNQAGKLWHTSNLYRIRQSEILARKLVDSSFADQVFFCNSGAEAVECGFKLIRRYHYDKNQPQRNRIVAMTDSFHGRTLATINASANPLHCAGFLVGDCGFDQAQYGDLESLRSVIGDNTAGIIIEPVQGEGGVRIVEPDYLAAVRQLCNELDLVLMFDEVQCGMARSGSLYAYEQLGVEPDLLASAKGLGGGFPVGACLAKEKLSASLVAGTHGSTFGGNPLAMAVANQVFDLLTAPAFLQHLNEQAVYIRESLSHLCEKHPDLIEGITGIGLMIGVKCVINNNDLIAALQQHKLLAVKAGSNTIRLLPALNVSRDEVDSALEILSNVLSQWNKLINSDKQRG
ncbi:MAG: aspartate aminotransferase family protein [Gammaproteobacteria bacterium]|jgi:acetylornithine/N-succinyldiaminopimelate aminotransferase|nr:acetylornithine transaminase [Gammaproteobacteria bacterium]MDP6097926.1 aspartate aminotransferase family protein [Gammaproteobacteria bacterium]HJO11647.1 aspartate aminotransferase family protein [Gammaproteobacteria bacterium]